MTSDLNVLNLWNSYDTHGNVQYVSLCQAGDIYV